MLSEVRHGSTISDLKEKIVWYHDVLRLHVSDL